MQLINKGKTKDVYKLESGNLLLKFKDDVTGSNGVFDPGANEVGLKMEGAGNAGLRVTKFFFEAFKRRGIPTHYISADIDNNTMEILEATQYGKGLECICRYKAYGSFYRRFRKYVEEGKDLDGFVEITIKDDEAGDPPISKSALLMLGILTEKEYNDIIKYTREISDVVKEILASKGLELYDIKLEFGKDKDGNLMLIDEVSGGNMRIYKGEESVTPLELPELLLV